MKKLFIGIGIGFMLCIVFAGWSGLFDRYEARNPKRSIVVYDEFRNEQKRINYERQYYRIELTFSNFTGFVEMKEEK